YISEPTRFEFLIALALKKAYPVLRVAPNYNTDDEGLPTSFAQGGGADIVCYDERGNILFEVTLLTGAQQNIREMPAIARHLSESIIKNPDSFSVMICPRAHSDTLQYAKFVKYSENLDIIVLETEAFVDTLGVYATVRSYLVAQ
ncbi:MAG: AlwI family type II restriction endonuclease, partial [Deferribacteraceae bacterium]|nr:AlwI family type II restriction endonuclease [Deferribacteraceae bacterium]